MFITCNRIQVRLRVRTLSITESDSSSLVRFIELIHCWRDLARAGYHNTDELGHLWADRLNYLFYSYLQQETEAFVKS